jgi:hypothetical protein
MPLAYARESDNSSKAPSIYLVAGEHLQRAGYRTKLHGWTPKTEGDDCNFGPGCQISIIGDFSRTQVTDLLRDLTKRLNEIRRLPDNWDSQGTAAPNTLAYLHAWDVIGVLTEMNFVPAKLMPSAEEGVGFYFSNKNRYGFVECYNEGEIVVAMSNRNGYRKVWQIRDVIDEIKDALETLRDFLNAA